MKLLSLSNNAFFLAHWRLRMRPSIVSSSLAVAFIVLILIILSVYADPSSSKNPEMTSFWLIAIVQGILLLIMAPQSISKIMVEENRQGTLDFHRASPTSKTDQVIGILLGAPSLEWCVFLTTLPVSFYFALTSPIGLERALWFYTSIILCAFFYHAAAILLGLTTGSNLKQSRIFSLFWVLIVSLWFMIPPSFYSKNSTLPFLTPLPQYTQIHNFIFEKEQHKKYGVPDSHKDRLSSTFYTTQLPQILFQIIVQIPLFFLIVYLIKRRLTNEHQPIFSKPQSLLTCALILFLIIGGAFPFLLDGNSSYFYDTTPAAAGSILGGIIALGILISLSITPHQLSFLKGLNRLKKLNQPHLRWDDDRASIKHWFMIYTGIAAITYLMIYPFFKGATQINYLTHGLTFGTMISYVGSFAFALEYFRFSDHHQKRSWFWVALSIPWIVLPIIGVILNNYLLRIDLPSEYFFSLSPFFGSGIIIEQITRNHTRWDHELFLSFFSINFLVLLIFLFLSSKEQQRLKKKVFG